MSKRFYKEVTVEMVDATWRVSLDGRAVKTPTKATLSVNSKTIAQIIAIEWDAQTEEIDPLTMPVTRLVGVAAERAGTRDELIEEFKAYASTDLLSYLRDAPDDFVARQTKLFGTWLDWAAENGVPLRTTMGILAIEQNPKTILRMGHHASEYSDLALTFLVHMTATFGSAMLALAVMQGALEAGEAYDISRMDEAYRAEIWGADENAEARAAAIRAEVVAMSAILPELDVPKLS